MKFESNIAIATLSYLLLANLTHSQSIDASYSMIYGSPWTGTTISARYPPSYGAFSSNTTPGGRTGNKIVVYRNLIYTFHGFKSPGNDVWAFNITDKTWAWIAGRSDSAAADFGNRGVAAVSNTPGFRASFGGDIDRKKGEYILYGGGTTDNMRLGDLWTFNLASNTWTWISGSSSTFESPNYNTVGISTAFTTPGARQSARCVVFPPTGEFLLYGGSIGDLVSDMWAFNFTDSRWTWLSGSSVPNIGAFVGQKGFSSTEYFPAGTLLSEIALDTRSNILYLFGGSSSVGPLNDLWSFNRETLEWAWISGQTSGNTPGVCESKGLPNGSNAPGRRYGHTLVYHRPSELLILFGGVGYACDGTYGSLSDTWAFNISSSEWTWIAGSSTLANNPVNVSIIRSQFNGAMSADTENQAIYMFGGYGYVSESAVAYVDYLWVTNITIAPIRQSNSTLSPASMASIPRSTSTPPPVSVYDAMTEIEISRYMKKETTSRKRMTTRVIANNDIALLKKLWSIKYKLLAAVLVVLLVLINCVAFRLTHFGRKRDETSNSIDTSITSSTFQTDSSSTATAFGQSTIAITTMAVYIPGGLQFDARAAYRTTLELAKGGGGTVWLATALDPALREYGDRIVVKVPNSNHMTGRDTSFFIQEIALMNAFKKSQNIVKLLGYSENPYSIIVKYYPNGSLSNWMASGKRTSGLIQAFLKDISFGIAELHYNGVVHCDLKPDNILIDYGWRFHAVIADLGISRIVTDKLLKVGAYEVQLLKGASFAYAAPEVIAELKGEKFSRIPPEEIMARDIYAFGMITIALLNGKSAWK